MKGASAGPLPDPFRPLPLLQWASTTPRCELAVVSSVALLCLLTTNPRHLKYTIPPALALTYLYRPLSTRLDVYKVLFLVTVLFFSCSFYATI